MATWVGKRCLFFHPTSYPSMPEMGRKIVPEVLRVAKVPLSLTSCSIQENRP